MKGNMEEVETRFRCTPDSICRCLRGCCARLRGSRMVTIEPALFLYMFSYFFYIVLFELYAFNRYGEESLLSSSPWDNQSVRNSCLSTDILDGLGGPNYTNRTGDVVEARVAILQLIVGVTAQLPSIIACLVLGPLSDHFGRKPAMMVALLGACFQAVMTVLIVWLKLPLYVFLVGAAAKGVTGGLAGILTISFSYIADVSSRKWLTLRLGILDALVYLAGTLSLGVGGVWIQLSKCDFRHISLAHLITMAATIPYFLFLVPESNPSTGKRRGEAVDKEELGTSSPTPAVGPKSLFRGFQIFFGRGYARWKLWVVLVTMILTVFNTTGGSVIITLFLLHKPLQWPPIMIGVYMGAHELMQGLSLLVFLPILIAVGLPDALISLIGLGIACAMNVCIGFVMASWEMFLGEFFASIHRCCDVYCVCH